MAGKGQGPLHAIMRYFGYTNMKDFRTDWLKLSKEDQEWFKAEITKVA
jgi:hypothetical protein